MVHIRYYLTEPGHIEFSVYDILGGKIKYINKSISISDEQEIIWDGKSENLKILTIEVYFSNIIFTSNSGDVVIFGKKLIKN
ncbi:MAG: hypothetical protein JXB17_04160 [Bacteroidales bacterium]|nr:hypothetical protein [Bacteroidales bacterium]